MVEVVISTLVVPFWAPVTAAETPVGLKVKGAVPLGLTVGSLLVGTAMGVYPLGLKVGAVPTGRAEDPVSALTEVESLGG